MEFVFFFYGLAFFLLGFAILMSPKKGSSFYLARKIHWVAGFGIIHGINEWLDLFIMVHMTGFSAYLEYLRTLTLPASFICLIYFGARVIQGQNAKCRMCKYLTPSLVVIWAAVFIFGEHSGLRWDIWSRYLLCVTGSTLTAVALWIHVTEIEGTKNFKLAFNLKVAASGFILYAFLAGLVVNDADFFPASVLNYSLFSSGLGIPVQVFRTICAVLIAYHLIRVLSIFQWETQQMVFNNEYRFKTVVETAPVILFMTDKEKRLSFIKGKGLASIGIKSTDVLQQPIGEVFTDIPQVSESVEKVLAGEEMTSTVSVGDLYYDIFLAPLRDKRGKIQGTTGVAVDVTPQKTAQNDIEKYRFEMEKNKALAAIGTLGTEMAREMTRPLHESKALFLKALSGLKKTIGAEEVKGDINQGIAAVSKAIRKLDGFCDEANLEKSVRSQPIEISEMTRCILSVLQETAQRKMVKIAVEGEEILPVMQMSRRELEQIVYTMIQAILTSMEGEHLHHLDITFSMQEKNLRIGLSEYRANGKVFGVENKSDQDEVVGMDTEKENFELSVLKRMTEANGGSVSVSPNSKGGLLHEITIPLAD